MTLRTSLAHTLPALRADPELLMFAKILPARLRWPCEKLFDTTILTNLSKMVEVPVSLQGGTSSVTKLLILSDSHNSPDVVQRILRDETGVDALIFLGDGLRDLEQGLTQHPRLRTYAVAGNCDYGALEPLDGLAAFDKTVVFYTHGHMYGVKYDLDTLAQAAAARGAEVALFGHTHIPLAEQRGGVFLFNPGSCGRCYTGPDTYGFLHWTMARSSPMHIRRSPRSEHQRGALAGQLPQHQRLCKGTF